MSNQATMSNQAAPAPVVYIDVLDGEGIETIPLNSGWQLALIGGAAVYFPANVRIECVFAPSSPAFSPQSPRYSPPQNTVPAQPPQNPVPELHDMTVDEDEECIICRTRVPHLTWPCGHRLCGECSDRITTGPRNMRKCPICRAPAPVWTHTC